jgi:hypothetical protein
VYLPVYNLSGMILRYLSVNAGWLAGAAFSGSLLLSPPSVFAKQVFTDDVGEVLYTIDDDGMVSMFESSPGTDVTLSVTRGTREQMRPQVTDIMPKTVPAGTFTVLKIVGRNLVGAKAKTNVAGVDVGAHSGRPKQLDVPLTVALSVPPAEITLEIITPIGQTTASFKISEVQLGGTGAPAIRDAVTHPGQGYSADEGVRSIAATAPTNCPQGMIGVGAEGGGFCIELDRSFKGDFYQAEKACAKVERRLCRLPELKTACEKAQAGQLPLKNMVGEWEWTGTYDIVRDFSTFADSGGDPVYALIGKQDCSAQKVTRQFDSKTYVGRCCK